MLEPVPWLHKNFPVALLSFEYIKQTAELQAQDTHKAFATEAVDPDKHSSSQTGVHLHDRGLSVHRLAR